jgi:hypothetical protein
VRQKEKDFMALGNTGKADSERPPSTPNDDLSPCSHGPGTAGADADA